MHIPKSHPRFLSLKTRDLIVNGIKDGITSMHGLIAHGRGEAYDYLIGEKTNDFALKSIEAASALLLTSKNPVISVNGNTAALVPRELSELSNILNAPLEVNIFHSSKKREIKIKNHLIENGAKKVLIPDKKYEIKFLDSNRKYVNKNGICMADVVLAALEDGDRTEALIKNKKKVIAVDLNPLSRTSQNATITIVDNVTRAVPALTMNLIKLKKYGAWDLKTIIDSYKNKKNLNDSLECVKNTLGTKCEACF